MPIPHPRLPRRTARLRLAVLCGGVFVLGATSVPAILLVAQLTNLARRSGNGALPGTRPDPTGITREVKSRSCRTPLQVPGAGLRRSRPAWRRSGAAGSN